MVTLAVGDEGFEDEGADQRLWQPGGNHPKSGGFPVTMDNVRLYIGLIRERHGLIGGSWLVGLHYRLGGPESAQCALGSSAAPVHRMPSSRPGDPIWNIGD
jgi:hypothetical protein